MGWFLLGVTVGIGIAIAISSRCTGARRDSIEISTNILIYPQIKRIYQQSYLH